MVFGCGYLVLLPGNAGNTVAAPQYDMVATQWLSGKIKYQ